MRVAAGPAGSMTVSLDPDEAVALAGWVTQIGDLVTPEELTSDDPLAAMVGIDTTPQRPHDPAVRRLFPDAYRDDDEAATEFRRYTEHDLRQRKHDQAALVLEGLRTVQDRGEVTLTAQDARAWVGSLNDLRLVLASRLGIEDEDDAAALEAWPADDDPAGPMVVAYHWLTYLQGTLVESLQPGHP